MTKTFIDNPKIREAIYALGYFYNDRRLYRRSGHVDGKNMCISVHGTIFSAAREVLHRTRNTTNTARAALATEIR